MDKKLKEKTKKAKSFFWSTHNWVVLYTIGYMALTVFYCLPRLILQLVNESTAASLVKWLGPTATADIPLQIFSWGLVAIVAGYSGIDRASLAVKSSLMEVGACDMGNPEQTRKSIILLGLVFIENVILNFVFGVDITIDNITYSGIKLPLEGVSSALVATVVAYVLGNKSIRLTQQLDKTKETEDWADEKESRVAVSDTNV